MDNKKIKKNKIIKVTALLGLFLLVFGVSYALFSVVLEGTKKNRITTGTLKLELLNEQGKIINDETFGIENAVPISASDGLNEEPYSFQIKNVGSIPATYTLYFEGDSTNTLSANYVKISLDRTRIADNTETLTFSQYESNGYNEEDGSKVENLKGIANSSLLSKTYTETKDGNTLYYLDKITIGPNQTYSYDLRMWLSYAADKNAMGKVFEGKIYIDAKQATANEEYIVEQEDITGNSTFDINLGLHQYFGLYSKGTIKISGKGGLSNRGGTILYSCPAIDEINISYAEQINEVLSINGYSETFNTMDEFYNYITELEQTNADIPWNETTTDQLATILNEYEAKKTEMNDNFDTYCTLKKLSGDLYFEDGITDIPLNYDSIGDGILNRIYISKTVEYMGASAIQSDFEELYFTDIENPFIKNNMLNTPKLQLDAAFRYNTRLKKAILPETLTQISSSAFSDSTNADIEILAKKSDVTIIGGTTLSDVKSVTWING